MKMPLRPSSLIAAEWLDYSIADRDYWQWRARTAEDALGFYADPETYFAILVVTDPPCGAFSEDFSETKELGIKPGKNAREALKLIEESQQ